MGDNCSVYMQIKAAISQMAALLYLSMSSAILRLRICKRKIAEDLSPCGKMGVKSQGAERS